MKKLLVLNRLPHLFIVISIIFVFFTSCSNPTAMEQSDDIIFSTANGQPAADYAPDEIQILSFLEDENHLFLSKPLLESKWIKANNGGKLKIKYNWKKNSLSEDEADEDEPEDCDEEAGGVLSKAKVKMTLKIASESFDSDTLFFMGIDNKKLDMNFGPHGLVFKEPAILNIRAAGLDLEGISPEDIKLFYDNHDTGRWEVMGCRKIVVNIKKGKVFVYDARLPHFSRYAVAFGR